MKNLIYALLISMFVTLLGGKLCIPMLKRLKFGQSERDLGPKTHLEKAGTPTMGGIMFLLGILFSTLIMTTPAHELVIVALLVGLFGALAFQRGDIAKQEADLPASETADAIEAK